MRTPELSGSFNKAWDGSISYTRLRHSKLAHLVLKLTAVAGAECNTVIELKLEHHAA